MDQLEINELFRTLLDTVEVKPRIMSSFDKYISPSNMTDGWTVTYMRTIINMGSPLDVNGTRFMNTSDRSSE